MAKVERYHPPVSRAVAWYGAVQFVALLGGAVLFLWHADPMPLARSSVWLAALAAGLWSVGAVMQGRISILQALLIEAAALSTGASAEGLVELHRVFKPLALLLAIAVAAGRFQWPATRSRFGALLVAALAFSLAGDCFLMFPGYFIPGLVLFLVAHLFYIALFRQGVAWFPSGRTLLITLGLGAAMYAFLFNRLDPVLKAAVAAYVIVIALMAAQAIGRAVKLRNKQAIAVAVGAAFFMLSDAMLATNKFAFALPMAQFWVLGTYYVAQILIASNAQPATAAAIQSPNSSPALFGGVTPR
jgi:uncharacterized membrane protein YhhN